MYWEYLEMYLKTSHKEVWYWSGEMCRFVSEL